MNAGVSFINFLSCSQIFARISTPLKFSLTRQQYEQLIETVDHILASMDREGSINKDDIFPGEVSHLLPNISEDSELRTNISALDLDPALRAKMLQRHSSRVNVETNLSNESFLVIYNGKLKTEYFQARLSWATIWGFASISIWFTTEYDRLTFKLLFLATFRNEITTILTPSTSEGGEWGRWGWSHFSFWRSLITNPQC